MWARARPRESLLQNGSAAEPAPTLAQIVKHSVPNMRLNLKTFGCLHCGLCATAHVLGTEQQPTMPCFVFISRNFPGIFHFIVECFRLNWLFPFNVFHFDACAPALGRWVRSWEYHDNRRYFVAVWRSALTICVVRWRSCVAGFDWWFFFFFFGKRCDACLCRLIYAINIWFDLWPWRLYHRNRAATYTDTNRQPKWILIVARFLHVIQPAFRWKDCDWNFRMSEDTFQFLFSIFIPSFDFVFSFRSSAQSRPVLLLRNDWRNNGSNSHDSLLVENSRFPLRMLWNGTNSDAWLVRVSHHIRFTDHLKRHSCGLACGQFHAIPFHSPFPLTCHQTAHKKCNHYSLRNFSALNARPSRKR